MNLANSLKAISKNIGKVYHDFKFSSGTPQYFMFGVWICIVGTTNATSAHMPNISALLMLSGLSILISTISQSRKLIKYSILCAVLLCVLILNLTIFTVYEEFKWGYVLETPILARAVLVIWGVYLANLCSRQLWSMRANHGR